MATRSWHPQTPSWDPVKLLNIVSPDKISITCVGHAPSQGRRCQNPIAKANSDSALFLLETLPAAAACADNARIGDILVELAGYLLCRRWHQGQASAVASMWLGVIKRYLQERCTATPAGEGEESARLARWRKELDHRAVELDEREGRLDEREEELNERLSEMDERDVELEKRWREANNREEELDKNTCQLDERDRESTLQKTHLDELIRVYTETLAKKRKVQQRNEAFQQALSKSGAEADHLHRADTHQEAERVETSTVDEERQPIIGAQTDREQTQVADNEAKHPFSAQADRDLSHREREDWSAAFAAYERDWSKLDRMTSDALDGLAEDLRSTVPWPVKSGKWQDVDAAGAKAFFTHAPAHARGTQAARAELLTDEWARWQPDNFGRRFTGAGHSPDVLRSVRVVFEAVVALMDPETRPCCREGRAPGSGPDWSVGCASQRGSVRDGPRSGETAEARDLPLSDETPRCIEAPEGASLWDRVGVNVVWRRDDPDRCSEDFRVIPDGNTAASADDPVVQGVDLLTLDDAAERDFKVSLIVLVVFLLAIVD